jgi:uncharacterized protein (TIGR00730 family)
MQVCVYCASSAKIDSAYFEATEALAKSLVANDCQVVFGGGSSGLMGKLADTVLENGGRIRGIMPQFMNEVEWGHKGVSDFIYTHTMHERKAKFLEGTDAIIALPGGPGTFEELFEAITLRKLGQISTPIVVLNTNGYFNLFADLMQQAVLEKFMTDDGESVWKMVNEPEDVITCIRDFKTQKIELTQAGTLR